MSQTNQQDAALASAEAAARSRPNDPDAQLQLGFAYFDQNRYTEARAALERVLALEPRSAAALEKIGHIHYRLNQPQEAERAYEQAIVFDPHYVSSYYGLGILYATKMGKPELTLPAIERGLAANPGNLFLEIAHASNMARVGKLDEAQRRLEQLAQAHPEEPDLFSWLSMLYLRQKRWQEAGDCCRREIALQPNHSAHRVLGFVELALGDAQAATAEFERALALGPHDYEARAALAKRYIDAGKLREGEAQYNRAVQDSQEDEEYGLACVKAVSGQTDGVIELLEQALRKGLVSHGWLAIDPELVYVQDEPGFQELVRAAYRPA